MPRPLFTLAACFSFVAVAPADNWPQWRGPTGQGQCAEKDVPLKWSRKENVKWRMPLPHPGNSTPVVWGDHIFVTMENEGGTERSLLCLNRADGKERWRKTVEYAKKETNWDKLRCAYASPVTDGERVVACFGSAGVYCYDFDGKELWKRDLGKWDHEFGSRASPVLYGDLVIQWCGPSSWSGNVLLAMNKKTGETEWRHKESYGSWCTPVIATIDKQDQLLLGQSSDKTGWTESLAWRVKVPEKEWGHLKGFDPKTGKELWACRGLNSYVFASPLVADGIAVGMSGYYGSAMAVKLGGSGDITGDRLWLHRGSREQVGSGVIIDGHVYSVDEDGCPHCYELKTGKDLWRSERQMGMSGGGSLVHADGRLYLLRGNADTLVLAASPKFELLATNSLGPPKNQVRADPLGGDEVTNSSVAISNGQIFIRTHDRLYCIEAKK